MKNWLRKHWLLTAFLLIGGVPASLNYSGFCWEEKRWLSREEFLLKGVIARADEKEGISDYSDESLRAYLKSHPKCCYVTMGTDGVNYSFIDRITGMVYAEFDTQYKLNQEALKRNNSKYHMIYFNMDACGKIGDGYGSYDSDMSPHYQDTNSER